MQYKILPVLLSALFLFFAGCSQNMDQNMEVNQNAPLSATGEQIQIIMGGYGPPTTGFSLALKQVGDRLEAKFGDLVDIKYVYNIMDIGYPASDILWLVESGLITIGYQSSSYMTSRVPELGVADLPFIFSDTEEARAAVDGAFGEMLATNLEQKMNYRILGFFENGFRHISNRVRPVRVPSDLDDLSIRVLPSEVQKRTFELLGADPEIMDLTQVIARVKAGEIDAQENPFVNTVTYGVHNFHKFHSETNHFYISRPIFVHQQSFDAWPKELQDEIRLAFKDAIAFQRELHIQEEIDSEEAIKEAGGTILRITESDRQAFIDAVAPIYEEARSQYSKELLSLVGIE